MLAEWDSWKNETAKAVLECTPVSDRIIIIRLAGMPFNMTNIQIYAPTSDRHKEEVDEFYEDLKKIMKKVPHKDVPVIQRDWKAKTGEDAHGSWSGTVGKFALGTTNDRGERLLQFAKTHQLVAANTLFKHQLSRRATYHSPEGKTHNQIDYILISRRFASGINKARARTMTKLDIGSDHDMVSMTFRA